jgi:protein-tyrosine phosphatase
VRRAWRSWVDRVLHARRQAAARKKLRQLGLVERVLFVCHGNIYRSPYAEVSFRSHLPAGLNETVIAVSAGFVGSGRPTPIESLELARRRGLDLSAHRSQLLTTELVRGSHLVVVMSSGQEREICRRFNYPRGRVLVLGDLDPSPIETREVMDPWNRPLEILEASTERVSRCVRELAGELEIARRIAVDDRI